MTRKWTYYIPTLGAIVAVAVVIATLVLPTEEAGAQQGLPVAPYIYSGSVTVAGAPAPDGVLITARIDEYASEAVVAEGGRYSSLTISPLEELARSLQGRPITFHLDGVQAEQTDTFRLSGLPVIKTNFNLVFPNLPVPTPTLTPIPTATPLVAAPAVYSGILIVAEGSVPAGAVLEARIGSVYVSPPAVVQGDSYLNLVVDPNDLGLVGSTVEFFLNGVRSSTTHTYQSGAFTRNLDLVFVGIPTPTSTPVPPTPTPVPPTATPVPPTATPVPPTATPVPPTATPVPPTATPVPPTATPVPPTATPMSVPPTVTRVISAPTAAGPSAAEATEVPSDGDGDCLASAGAPLSAGLANVLLLVAPLGLVVGFRRSRRGSNRPT